MQSGLTLKAKQAYNKNASTKLFTNYVKKIAALLGVKHKTLDKISNLYEFEKRIAHVSTQRVFFLPSTLKKKIA